mmetsp:Transcript_34794/g.53360  ORF Transcript_34794/g.53360 Transcript_34794/m.53360 type:complete len:542 (+) Transcript_34794:10-1635(+)
MTGGAFQRLFEASRGRYVAEQLRSIQRAGERRPLKYFNIKNEHLGQFSPSNLTGTEYPQPKDFHRKLCDLIRNAEQRVKFASLYVGTGTGNNSEKELELLDALESFSSKEGCEIRVVMDSSRALRPVSLFQSEGKTSSAIELHRRLQKKKKAAPKKIIKLASCCDGTGRNGVYLFDVVREPLKSILPSPLDEVAGVFHVKAYIVDDKLILSGANLSEEYFSDRQDRYVILENGAGGLVDFYSDLIDVLCAASNKFDGPTSSSGKRWDTSNDSERKSRLVSSLTYLFDGSKDPEISHLDEDISALAVPTFQFPPRFFSSNQANKLPFLSDVETTRNLLETFLEEYPRGSLYLSSAYLNPTRFLLPTLSRFGSNQEGGGGSFLLTAGTKSHGFSRKPGQGNGSSKRDWVPRVFEQYYQTISNELHSGGILLYQRENWTFHAKGVWLCGGNKENSSLPTIPNEFDIVAGIVGSGNFGERSEKRDVESNCIFLLNNSGQSGNKLQKQLKHEWNEMCPYVEPYKPSQDSSQNMFRWAHIPLLKQFF